MRAVEFLIDGDLQLCALEKAYLVFQASTGNGRDMMPLPLHLIWPNPTIDIVSSHLQFTPTVFFVALADGLYLGLANLLMPDKKRFDPEDLNQAQLAHQYVVKPIGRQLIKWSVIKELWGNIHITLYTRHRKKKPYRQFSLEKIRPADQVFSQIKKQMEDPALPGSIAIMEPQHDFFSLQHAQAFETQLADDQAQYTISYTYDFSII